MTKTEKANVKTLTRAMHDAMGWWSLRSMDKPFGKRENRAFEAIQKLTLDAEAWIKKK